MKYYIDTPQGLCPVLVEEYVIRVPPGLLDASWKMLEQMLGFDCNHLKINIFSPQGALFVDDNPDLNSGNLWVSLDDVDEKDPAFSWKGFYRLVKEIN